MSEVTFYMTKIRICIFFRWCWSWLSWESWVRPVLSLGRLTPWLCWNRPSQRDISTWRTCWLAHTLIPERWALAQCAAIFAYWCVIIFNCGSLVYYHKNLRHNLLLCYKVWFLMSRRTRMAAVRRSVGQPLLTLWQEKWAWCLPLVSWLC